MFMKTTVFMKAPYDILDSSMSIKHKYCDQYKEMHGFFSVLLVAKTL